MKKKTSIAAIMIGMITLLGVGAQTVYAASYTATQVASHNVASDCWEVINGKVYNLTAFIPLHSGGQSVIIGQCGKDATAVFTSGPHSASTITALGAYLLGDLGVTPAVTTTQTSGTVVIAPVSSTTNVGTQTQTTKPKHARHIRANEDSHSHSKEKKGENSKSSFTRSISHESSGRHNDDDYFQISK